MSPQSKGRKREPSGSREGDRPPGPEQVVARLAQEAVRELEAVSDALDAELYVSELLGMWWGKDLGGVDPEVELGERLVAHAGRTRRPGAVGLLRVVAVLGTEAQREQAATAAAALVDGGVEEPAWVRTLGTERVVGAWEYGDAFGDQASVLLVVERAGARHGVVALVDRCLAGIVKDVFLTAEPDRALAVAREFAEDPGTYLREVEPRAAAALLVPAFDVTDSDALTDAELRVSEEFPVSRAAALARVRLLPDPGPPPGPALPDEAAQAAAVAEFLAAPEARDLPAAARGCVELLVDFGCVNEPARPLRVGPGLIDHFLDTTLNGGPELTDEEVAALPATVRAWAEWAGRRAGLPGPAMAELREAVDDMACAIGRPGDADPRAGDVADAYLAGLDLDAMTPEDLPGVLERRMFAMPFVGTRIGGEEFPFLDPGDPDDRGMLVEGEHPEYHDALADPGTDVVDGVNPRLHITLHEIVANQLWDDDPPQVWQAARRLLATGAQRHDVLHAIADVLVGHLHGVLSGEGDGDVDRYVAELERLGREPSDVARVIPLRRKR